MNDCRCVRQSTKPNNAHFDIDNEFLIGWFHPTLLLFRGTTTRDIAAGAAKERIGEQMNVRKNTIKMWPVGHCAMCSCIMHDVSYGSIRF